MGRHPFLDFGTGEGETHANLFLLEDAMDRDIDDIRDKAREDA
jgi:hypothetical protein